MRLLPLFVACASFCFAGSALCQGTDTNALLAARGQRIYQSKQCGGCHSFGRRQSTGPDLLGVTDRRSPEWLHAWLVNPSAPTDPTANMLRKDFGSQMPNMELSDKDADALIAYLAERTKEKK